MEQNNKIQELTPEELAEFINLQDENTIVSITITEIQEGGDYAGRENI